MCGKLEYDKCSRSYWLLVLEMLGFEAQLQSFKIFVFLPVRSRARAWSGLRVIPAVQ